MVEEVRKNRGARGTPPTRPTWEAGVIGGLLGAAVMGLLAMIVAAASGAGFWAPLKLISAVFLGRDALAAGAGAVVLGLIVHLAVGSFWGVVFAFLLPRGASIGADIGGALLYGAVLFFFMTYLVLPWANPLMFSMVNKGWFFVYHLAYGLAVASVLPIRRNLTLREQRVPA